MKTLFQSLALALATLFLAACAESPYDDVHAAPRESQPWENIDLAPLSTPEIIAHLQVLGAAVTQHTEAGDTIEFHHLEVAINAALDALQPQLADKPEALATIESLKPLAIKLHVAGHDSNVAMGKKLAAPINNYINKLATQAN